MINSLKISEYLNTRVKVYRNLHSRAGTLYSVMNSKGRVIGHVESILLENVKFHVREGGRQRVLRDKRKNVHAFVIGDIAGCASISGEEYQLAKPVKYNPYAGESFTCQDLKVSGAKFAAVNGYGVSAYGLEYKEG